MNKNEPAVIYETPDYGEAIQLKAFLEANGIACELLNKNSNVITGSFFIIPIQLLVPGLLAEKAFELIRDYKNDTPDDNKSGDTGEGPVCPNCGETLPLENVKSGKCPGCAFGLESAETPMEPEAVSAVFPDAKTFCSSCFTPSTFPGGNCGICSGPLFALAGSEKLCPDKLHVLEPGNYSEGEIICTACKKIRITAK